MEYDAVERTEIEALVEIVNKMISEKWEPVGGISVSVSESETYAYSYYVQAMVRK